MRVHFFENTRCDKPNHKGLLLLVSPSLFVCVCVFVFWTQCHHTTKEEALAAVAVFIASAKTARITLFGAFCVNRNYDAGSRNCMTTPLKTF